jgi:hypothetical protein
VEGEYNTRYCIIMRVNTVYPRDFSLILCTYIEDKRFRLRRYNGDAGSHRNIIERNRVGGFHRHTATQRYQDRSLREDSFVEPSTGFTDPDSALKLLQRENNVFPAIAKNNSRLF